MVGRGGPGCEPVEPGPGTVQCKEGYTDDRTSTNISPPDKWRIICTSLTTHQSPICCHMARIKWNFYAWLQNHYKWITSYQRPNKIKNIETIWLCLTLLKLLHPYFQSLSFGTRDMKLLTVLVLPLCGVLSSVSQDKTYQNSLSVLISPNLCQLKLICAISNSQNAKLLDSVFMRGITAISDFSQLTPLGNTTDARLLSQSITAGVDCGY